ncbi:MAG TPA: SpoIIE family protein phosphatase [Mycobacteriales bacterium]|nr:SpoIIE family protein phosphatase [Mycobacteriales bacterium]
MGSEPARELAVGQAADAVPLAWRFVTDALRDEPAAVIDDARLVAIELVTNATLHGLPPVTVRVLRHAECVRIEVEDAGQSAPMLPAHSTEAMTGRGLRLVAAVSSRWGVDPSRSGGKIVWAELASTCGSGPDAAGPAIDVDGLKASWAEGSPAEELFTVRLGAVPTDLLLAAKSHIDNVVREAILQGTGSAGMDNPPEISALIHTVTREFASARAEIKRQAIEAASRGQAETELVLTQPASAADAGERYLAALDTADHYARDMRLLTLESPPVHKLFRRWYVQALVDQLRAKAAGQVAPPPPTFMQVLAGEMATVASLRDAAAQLELLKSISAELTGARTIEEISAVVVERSTDFLGAASGRVMIVEGDQLVSVATQAGHHAAAPKYERIPLDADLPGPVAIRERRALMFRNWAHLAEEFPALAEVYDADRTLHVAPLSIGDHAVGVLSLSFPVVGRLDPEAQAAFVLALAAALAQAIERALAMETAKVASERLSFLADASVALGASLDYPATAKAVCDLLVPRLADWCVVQVLEDDELVTIGLTHFDPAKVAWAEEVAGDYPVDMKAPTGAPNVIRTGMTECYPEIPQEMIAAAAQSPEHLTMLTELGLVSALVTPLAGRSGIFGALTLIYAESGRHYSAADVPYVEDVSRRAALALETARVFRDQSGRLADVTRVAEAAQNAILAPPPPRIGPFVLAARYASAAAEALIGGDLYEVVPRQGAVRLLIGDVRGKGLAAVRTATIVLGEFRSAATDIDEMSGVARAVDRRVRAYLGDEDFVTALLAEVRTDGSFTIVNCGHPPALVAAGGLITSMNCDPTLPLGLGAEPSPVEGRLAVGDRLLLMTDGLLEARCPDRSFIDALAVLDPLARESEVEQALDRVFDNVHDAVGVELGDDLALLVTEYAGPTA